jgi:hypothetical protein
MLSYTQLNQMAKDRIADAKALLAADRFDGAVYVVGYAVEFKLKARIATSLFAERAFPSKSDELATLRKLQSHALEDLVRIAGRDKEIATARNQAAWSAVVDKWKPDLRYSASGSATQQDALDMIEAVERLMRAL